MPQTVAMKKAQAKSDKRRRDLLAPKGKAGLDRTPLSRLDGRVVTLQQFQQLLDGGSRRRRRGGVIVTASDRALRARTEVDYRSQMQSSGGSGIHRSPDHTYPLKAAALLNAPRPLLNLPLARTDFTADTSQKMRDDLHTRPDDVLTPYDRIMLANPAASLQDEGIDRTHRLANSSMLAITNNIFNVIHEARHTSAAQVSSAFQPAVIAFFAAVCGDASVAAAAYTTLDGAAQAEVVSRPTQRPATAAVQAVANGLANSPHNLRFGRAEANRIILHGFDPNRYLSGAMTPSSQAIHDTGTALMPFLSLDVMSAALQETVETATGAPMSSSS